MKRRSLVRSSLLFIGLLFGIFFIILSTAANKTEDVRAAAPVQQNNPVIDFDTYQFGENGNPIDIVSDDEVNINENEDDNDNDSSDAPEIIFTVKLDSAPDSEINVQYRTFDGTAVGGSNASSGDYTIISQGSSNELTFDSNTTTAEITVVVHNDTVYEPKPDEFFFLELIVPDGLTSGAPVQMQINIDDDDPVPTTATNTPQPSVLVDEYEPNDSLADAYTTAVDAGDLCDATLWPTGDTDYFRFVGKSGSHYRVFTTDLDPGLDTKMTVYDTEGDVIGQNDDISGTDQASEVYFTADTDGFYFARIENASPADATNLAYCFDVQVQEAPPQPTASPTRTGGDECEFNSTIATACEIGVTSEDDSGTQYNFEPIFGSSQDTDYYRLWMKPSLTYTCETFSLSAFADTNMIFLDGNGNDFQPNLGNDDKEPGDLGSKLTYRSTYTGWLHILIGPVNPPAVEDAINHTYNLRCWVEAATPTPTPTATRPPSTGSTGGTGTGGGVVVATPTPFDFPTPLPTPTPIDFSVLNTPTPAPPPVVVFSPLPTSTPIAGGQQLATVNVTVYYDGNGNFTPELIEGVMDVAVALYDNATGSLLAFGYTNEAGMIRFDSIATSGAVRIAVPYLNYSQVAIDNNANILVRIAPQPLPIGIP